MSDTPETVSTTAPATEIFARPEALLRVPMGLASPLWGLFAGAAMTGAAWWWMTRFARVENLEAMFGAAEMRAATLPLVAAEGAVAAAIETLDAVQGAMDQVVEPAVETVEETIAEEMDAALEAAPSDAPAATLLDALEAGAETPAPVGGESAPISPLVADMAAEPAQAEPEEAEPARSRRKPKAD